MTTTIVASEEQMGMARELVGMNERWWSAWIVFEHDREMLSLKGNNYASRASPDAGRIVETLVHNCVALFDRLIASGLSREEVRELEGKVVRERIATL